ncbi:hypothetical protein P171DRAFT_436196 [Karstenula rhodostoma CBS 690.94]|uniref:Uncharacterized protein n=1 Tax=Karstenula rhodostoma CBS 690.94 TaxID=1392251 RepID=A0A9P4P8Q5_9PLEO|nr:hypothetical protein P171DRAFT_436196 [Karstenula rhodostoma CBS 690.94]
MHNENTSQKTTPAALVSTYARTPTRLPEPDRHAGHHASTGLGLRSRFDPIRPRAAAPRIQSASERMP